MSKFGLPGEANLYNAGFKLQIEHVPTSTTAKKNMVEFAAYLHSAIHIIRTGPLNKSLGAWTLSQHFVQPAEHFP